MASEFADKLIDQTIFKGDDQTLRLMKQTVDVSTSVLSNALAHARYRNHDHKPASCDACSIVEAAAESLRIK